MSKWMVGAQWVTVVVALGALGASVVFNLQTNERLDKQNERLDEQNEQLDEQNEQLDEQEDRRINEVARIEREQRASAVYFGERSGPGLPTLPPDRNVWIVVNNASRTQINDVWVEGENNTSTLIQGIEACTIYALEPDFRAVAVHYRDTLGRGWHRTWEDISNEYEDYGPPDTHDSPWALPIENCPR